MAVFEDGCIYLYEKDVNYDPKEDPMKTQIGEAKKGEKPMSKADVIVEMQRQVENFDFESVYREQAAEGEPPVGGPLKQEQFNQGTTMDELVNVQNCIYNWS